MVRNTPDRIVEIRNIAPEDIQELKRIHMAFFKDEFDFPDFMKGFYGSFVVEDTNNNIIVAGGVRPLAEMVCITNKDLDRMDRKLALSQALEMCEFIAKKSGFDYLHVFAQGPSWLNRLYKTGFRPTKGTAISVELI